MLNTGLVSISFRSLSCEQLIENLKKCGLKNIEWGSDVHAPVDNEERLYEIRRLMEENGINCCSYGSYFRISVNPVDEIYKYIKAAKILGTNIIRLWCGNKGTDVITAEETEKLFADCKALAKIGEEEGVIFCMECHNDTYTDNVNTALKLMEEVNSPAFRMYWQPNQHKTFEENMHYAKTLSAYTYHLHVFNWAGHDRLPLKDAVKTWKDYLTNFEGERYLLLEFMPDDKIETLPVETEALNAIVS